MLDQTKANDERTVLTIFAHPDDAELSCFGLLLKLRKRGWKVVLVAVTRGENGADTSVWNREDEARAAARRLDAEIVFGDFRDGYVPRSAELVDWVEQLLDKYRPDTVLSHFNGESRISHQDHIAVEAAVQIAIRRASWHPTLLLAEGIYNDMNFEPNWFVDITEEYPEKIAAIRFHKSQSEKFYMKNSYLEIRSKKWSLNFVNNNPEDSSDMHWEAFYLAQHAM